MMLLRSSLRVRQMSTSTLKALREMTGAPLMDCKNALSETGGDLEKAKAWIAERNKTVAQKISGRAAKQGLIGLALSDKAGALCEVNCETDFVARNADFQAFVRQQTTAIMEEKPLSPDALTTIAGKVRENIVLGSAHRLVNNGVLGSYLHNMMGENVGTSAAIVSISGPGDKTKLEELARALAVQVVGAKPQHLSREDVSPEVRKEAEAKILEESKDILAGKPEKAKESLLRGRMQKFYGDLCLMDQSFILGELEGKVVKDVLPKGVKIDGFIRLAVGGN